MNMHSHKLTKEDSWFIEKGYKDSLSKTPFEVGQIVVVCDNRHVMLAEFYEGECPTCHSGKTVPFSRQNVEVGTWRSYTGECPECFEKTTILFRQYGANNPFVGKCPKCNNNLFISENFFAEGAFILKTRRFIGRVNMVLEGLLGILIICIIILLATGGISNDNLIDYSKSVILPRTQVIYKGFWNFIISDEVCYVFMVANKMFLARNVIFFGNIAVFFRVFTDGSKVFGIGLWEQLQIIVKKTVDMIESFGRPIKILLR